MFGGSFIAVIASETLRPDQNKRSSFCSQSFRETQTVSCRSAEGSQLLLSYADSHRQPGVFPSVGDDETRGLFQLLAATFVFSHILNCAYTCLRTSEMQAFTSWTFNCFSLQSISQFTMFKKGMEISRASVRYFTSDVKTTKNVHVTTSSSEHSVAETTGYLYRSGSQGNLSENESNLPTSLWLAGSKGPLSLNVGIFSS